MSIKTIWSHYGEDCTGGGCSEVEVLSGIESEVRAGRFEEAKAKFEALEAVASSYGYGEADGFLSDQHDSATDEGQAHIQSYEGIWETDYANTIDATESYFFKAFPERAEQAVLAKAIQSMRDGYEAGRRQREHAPAPAMSM